MSVYISVVIPVYNSARTLAELFERTRDVLRDLCGENYEIILVDDYSSDESYKKMNALHKIDSRVKIIQLAKNFGQQNAIMCGFHYGDGDYIVTIDDDLQHPPEEIKKMVEKLDDGYDVVFGIPIEKKHSFYRNLATKLIGYLFNRICEKPKNVRVSSFRAMKKEVVKKVIGDKTSFVYIAPMIFKITTNVENVLVRHDERKYGQSNYNLMKLMKLFMKLIISYSSISRFLKVSSKPQFVIKNIEL